MKMMYQELSQKPKFLKNASVNFHGECDTRIDMDNVYQLVKAELNLVAYSLCYDFAILIRRRSSSSDIRDE
jgi:hypothetical protein